MSTVVNWPQLLTDVSRLMGHPSTNAFARELGHPRLTIYGWWCGAEPRHSVGEALIARWCELTGKTREELPISEPKVGNLTNPGR